MGKNIRATLLEALRPNWAVLGPIWAARGRKRAHRAVLGGIFLLSSVSVVLSLMVVEKFCKDVDNDDNDDDDDDDNDDDVDVAGKHPP